MLQKVHHNQMMKFEFCLLQEFQTSTQKVTGSCCQHLQVQSEGAKGVGSY